ncbi:MAG: YajQ family cyclic di-GMP-binding protein [Myxococcales bacterium]|nr:YajQ family cyclic di-GMP-binding protein [Polyangiaceae bacterium]MDW8248984.1 YajQ family cyclic di-GMP-binding protein [Myxococcales bacterium]
MPSFDVVSKVEWHEVENALGQAQKEVAQRFDFRGTETEVERNKEELVIRSSTEDRAKAALQVLQEKMVKRKVSLKFLEVGRPEPTSKGGMKITIKVKEGVDSEKAKAIVAAIKDSKLKVQGSIQGGQVRVTGKNKDDLQACIQLLRSKDFGIELQFTNFRD